MNVNDVSVAIATYNGVDVLGPTLKSLEEQQTESLRISIYDDASTDGSFDLITSWAKASRHNVTIDGSNTNSGPSQAYWNAAYATETDFIVLMSQDDILGRNHVSTLQSLAIKNHHAAAVMPTSLAEEWRAVTKRGIKQWIVGKESGWQTVITLLGGNVFFAPGTLVRRSYWTQEMMHPANMQAQDYELWLRLALRGRLIQSKQRVKYVIHESNLHNANRMDHDLDVGLTIRRFLGSPDFKSASSKLGPDDRQNLFRAIDNRLTIHFLRSPVIYFVATLDTPWRSKVSVPPAGLYEVISTVLDMPTQLSNWDRATREKVLLDLREWQSTFSNSSLIGHTTSEPTRMMGSVLHKFERLRAERESNLQLRDLPKPWVGQ